MQAAPIIARIAELLDRHHLEAILIGNAAAALHGAPVTTVDLDFFFRKTPANLKKLKSIARELDAVLLKPYYPTSGLIRLMRESDGLQIDFMSEIYGIASFEGLRKRAARVPIGAVAVLAAPLADIIKSKKAAGRPRDLAVLEILEKTLEETARHQKGETGRSQKRE